MYFVPQGTKKVIPYNDSNTHDFLTDSYLSTCIF